jgi:tetratricopeptide (TPR) repeat protein
MPDGFAPTQTPETVDDGIALYLRGLTMLRDGDPGDAACLLFQALRRQPAHPGMRRNLIRALLAARRFDQVLPQADAALAADPDNAELHFARGTALNALGRHTAACAAFHRSVLARPDFAPALLNWGNASVDLDDLDAAEGLYRAAIQQDPTLVEAHASLAYVLTRRGNLTQAIAACDAAIRLRPDFAQAQWNRAIALLTAGDYTTGFAAYEWRKRHPAYRRDFPSMSTLEWDGSDPAGRRILVRGEQGMGDAIHFARYLAAIQARGGTPILACHAALAPLIDTMPGVETCAPDACPTHDAWIDQMSLALRLGTIPYPEGYLTADPRGWATRLGRRDGDLLVGLALAGNPDTPTDRRRSVPAELTQVLPAIDQVRFINLQHGKQASRLALPDLTGSLPDYAATAELIAALDLVICADTSIAHLAGALGKPTWLLLPTDPDWRWMLGRDDSPWYASIRIIRQTRPRDWGGVLDRVFADLATYDCPRVEAVDSLYTAA